MTFCMPRPGASGLAWLSLKVGRQKDAGGSEPTSIDSVGVMVYHPFDSSFRLMPYEVCVGDLPNDCQQRCLLPTIAEPTHGGRPVLASCHGAKHSYITVRQTGAARINGNVRRMFMSEVVAYTASANDLGAPLLRPRSRGDVAREVSSRFESGRPSDEMASAGVAVHIFDGYMDEEQPWEMCHDACRHGPVDTLSSSLISRKVSRQQGASSSHP